MFISWKVKSSLGSQIQLLHLQRPGAVVAVPTGGKSMEASQEKGTSELALEGHSFGKEGKQSIADKEKRGVHGMY